MKSHLFSFWAPKFSQDLSLFHVIKIKRFLDFWMDCCKDLARSCQYSNFCSKRTGQPKQNNSTNWGMMNFGPICKLGSCILRFLITIGHITGTLLTIQMYRIFWKHKCMQNQMPIHKQNKPYCGAWITVNSLPASQDESQGHIKRLQRLCPVIHTTHTLGARPRELEHKRDKCI